MPFASRRQARWAFANKKPFAKRWAKQTNFSNLPASKDAGAVASASLHGPGGLLATPGMGGKRKARRWETRTKAAGYSARAGETITGNLKRGTDGKFAAAGAPSAPTKRGIQLSKQPKPIARQATAAPKGGKGKGGKGGAAAKPKKVAQTPEQKRAARAAEQQQSRASVASQMADNDSGLSPSGSDALGTLAKGGQPSKALGDGLVTMGLAELAADGTYRMSGAGRATSERDGRGRLPARG